MAGSQACEGGKPSAQWTRVRDAHDTQRWTHSEWWEGKRVRKEDVSFWCGKKIKQISPTFRINCCEQGADKKWEIIENIKIQGVFNPWIQWRRVRSIFEKFLLKGLPSALLIDLYWQNWEKLLLLV